MNVWAREGMHWMSRKEGSRAADEKVRSLEGRLEPWRFLRNGDREGNGGGSRRRERRLCRRLKNGLFWVDLSTNGTGIEGLCMRVVVVGGEEDCA